MSNNWILTTITLPIIELDKTTKDEVVFTKELVDKLIFEDKPLMEMLASKSLFGEIRPDIDNCWFGAIDLTRVSHCVTQLEIRDNILYGTIDILETPQGRILNFFLSQGCKLYLQPRLIKVDGALECITFDIDFLNRC